MSILNHSLTALALAGAALAATPAMAEETDTPSSTQAPEAQPLEAVTEPKESAPEADNGFFVPDVHLLVSSNDTVVTGEYAWQNGRLSGFGFIDISTATDFYITDHEVRVEVTGPVFVSAEGGYNRYGGAMGKIGIGVNLTRLPVVRDNFAYLRVYVQKSVFGPDADHLVGMSWRTKDIQLGHGTSLYFSGFADIKANAPDVVQPQAWLRFDGLPIEVGSEVSFFGRDRTVSAAVKLNF